jgi:hypothetical protein
MFIKEICDERDLEELRVHVENVEAYNQLQDRINVCGATVAPGFNGLPFVALLCPAPTTRSLS